MKIRNIRDTVQVHHVVDTMCAVESAANSMRGSTPNAPMGPSSSPEKSQPVLVQLHWMACDLRIATCANRFANAIAMRVLHFAVKRCSLCPLRVWAISLSFLNIVPTFPS
jgi:hypothetical protein